MFWKVTVACFGCYAQVTYAWLCFLFLYNAYMAYTMRRWGGEILGIISPAVFLSQSHRHGDIEPASQVRAMLRAALRLDRDLPCV